MPCMPHVVNKALFFSYLDSRYSKIDGWPISAMQPTERLAILAELYEATPNLFQRFSTLAPPAGSTAADDMANSTLPTDNLRLAHLYHHWFGYQWNAGTQEWEPVPVNAAGPPAPTGWWSSWRGRAHDIFAETLTRAIEVSLGLPHQTPANPAPEPGEPTRLWPISFLWTCGSPKFEGWIEWRVHDSTSKYGGEVHVIFSTPGISSAVGGPAAALSDRLTFDIGNPPGQIIHASANYMEDPPTPVDEEQGIWVIGHDVSEMLSAAPTEVEEGFDPYGEPSAIVSGIDPIVVVRPAEDDGGVLSAGRHW